MTSKEFFIFTIKDEMPRFNRVFKALQDIPEEKWDYKPDPKSRSAKELVIHTFGSEGATFPIFLETGKLDASEFEKVMAKSVGEAVLNFSKQFDKVIDMLGKMSEEDWSSKAVMTMGEKVMWETSKEGMAWSLFLDLVHHRGQLSTYLRPMGGKVPAIYGPSADSSDQ